MPPLHCAALSIGLAHGLQVVRPVAKGAVVTEADVSPLPETDAATLRRQLAAELRAEMA